MSLSDFAQFASQGFRFYIPSRPMTYAAHAAPQAVTPTIGSAAAQARFHKISECCHAKLRSLQLLDSRFSCRKFQSQLRYFREEVRRCV